jgi:hypothetical protein
MLGALRGDLQRLVMRERCGGLVHIKNTVRCRGDALEEGSEEIARPDNDEVDEESTRIKGQSSKSSCISASVTFPMYLRCVGHFLALFSVLVFMATLWR